MDKLELKGAVQKLLLAIKEEGDQSLLHQKSVPAGTQMIIGIGMMVLCVDKSDEN